MRNEPRSAVTAQECARVNGWDGTVRIVAEKCPKLRNYGLAVSAVLGRMGQYFSTLAGTRERQKMVLNSRYKKGAKVPSQVSQAGLGDCARAVNHGTVVAVEASRSVPWVC